MKLVGMVLAFVPPVPLAAARPNIVLVLVNDQRWNETGSNRHPHLKTAFHDEQSAFGLGSDRS